MLPVCVNNRTFASSKDKQDNKLKIRERKKMMMLTMFSLAVEVIAAAEAMYICKNAKKLGA